MSHSSVAVPSSSFALRLKIDRLVDGIPTTTCPHCGRSPAGAMETFTLRPSPPVVYVGLGVLLMVSRMAPMLFIPLAVLGAVAAVWLLRPARITLGLCLTCADMVHEAQRLYRLLHLGALVSVTLVLAGALLEDRFAAAHRAVPSLLSGVTSLPMQAVTVLLLVATVVLSRRQRHTVMHHAGRGPGFLALGGPASLRRVLAAEAPDALSEEPMGAPVPRAGPAAVPASPSGSHASTTPQRLATGSRTFPVAAASHGGGPPGGSRLQAGGARPQAGRTSSGSRIQVAGPPPDPPAAEAIRDAFLAPDVAFEDPGPRVDGWWPVRVVGVLALIIGAASAMVACVALLLVAGPRAGITGGLMMGFASAAFGGVYMLLSALSTAGAFYLFCRIAGGDTSWLLSWRTGCLSQTVVAVQLPWLVMVSFMAQPGHSRLAVKLALLSGVIMLLYLVWWTIKAAYASAVNLGRTSNAAGWVLASVCVLADVMWLATMLAGVYRTMPAIKV